MQIKLTPIPFKESPKDKYFVEVEVMHGDADSYDHEMFPCDNAEEFEKIMLAYEDMPTPEAEGGDDETYCNWCDELFGELFVPGDVVYNGCRATVSGMNGFYYDGHGVKFKAELVK